MNGKAAAKRIAPALVLILYLGPGSALARAEDASVLLWGDPRTTAAEEAFILAGVDPPLLEQPPLAGRLRRELLALDTAESSRIADDLKAPLGPVLFTPATSLSGGYSGSPDRDATIAPPRVFDETKDASQLSAAAASGDLASVFRARTTEDRIFRSALAMGEALAKPSVLDLRLRLLVDPVALDIDPEIRPASNWYRTGDPLYLNYGLIASPSSIDVNVPYRGLASLLSGPFELRMGRDKLQLGPGRASTLSYNAAIPWADYAKASVEAGPVSLSWYYVRLNPYMTDDERRYLSAIYDYPKLAVDYGTNYYELIHGEAEKNLAISRITWRICPWATLAFTQHDLVGGRGMQLSDLNPLIIWHNLFQEGVYGVPAMLEASLTPLKGLRFYGQYMLYDAVVADEKSSSTQNAGASAYQAGLTWLYAGFAETSALSGQRLRLDAEATLTDPWVYGKAYSLRQFASRFIFVEPSAEERVWVDYPIGPYFGPDCADLDLRLGLGSPEGWEASLTGGYRESGSITLVGYGEGSDYAHQADYHRDGLAYVKDGEASERRLRLGLEASSPRWDLGRFSLRAKGSFQAAWASNYGCAPGLDKSWISASLSVVASLGE